MSTFDPLLAIMHPRDISECIHAFERLDVRRAWLSRFTEYELQSVIASIIADDSIAFTHLALVSDDCVVTPDALGAVFELARSHDVATGYCRLATGHPMVNLTRRELMGDTPSAGAYDFYSFDEVAGYNSEVVPTGFAGFAVTVMPRDMWARFPFQVFGGEASPHASDFALSIRLRDAGVPIVAARAGYVEHVKSVVNTTDRLPGRELLVGVEPSRVEVE